MNISAWVKQATVFMVLVLTGIIVRHVLSVQVLVDIETNGSLLFKTILLKVITMENNPLNEMMQKLTDLTEVNATEVQQQTEE